MKDIKIKYNSLLYFLKEYFYEDLSLVENILNLDSNLFFDCIYEYQRRNCNKVFANGAKEIINLLLPLYNDKINAIEKYYKDYNFNLGIPVGMSKWSPKYFRFLIKRININNSDINDINFSYILEEYFYLTQDNKFIEVNENIINYKELFKECEFDKEEEYYHVIACLLYDLFNILKTEHITKEIFFSSIKPLMK